MGDRDLAVQWLAERIAPGWLLAPDNRFVIAAAILDTPGVHVAVEYVVEGGEEDDDPWISYPKSAEDARRYVEKYGGRPGVRYVITTPTLTLSAQRSEEQR